MEIQVIYSDKDLIVINKPPRISVHGGFTVSGPTVTDFLIEKFPEVNSVGDDPVLRPGIVHRLDKDTSGVMVAARNQETFTALKNLFQKRLVDKTYLAICCGKFKEKTGVVSFPIGRLKANPLKRGVDDGGGRVRSTREALTEYTVIKSGPQYSLIKLHPKTGRMHQLRVHMKALNHPIACDTVYGGKNVCCPPAQAGPGGVGRQLLHAASLSFSYPEGRKLIFEAEPPEDFAIAEKLIL